LTDKVLRVLTVRLEPDWAEAAKKQAVLDAQARAAQAELEASGQAVPAVSSMWGDQGGDGRRSDRFASGEEMRGMGDDDEGEEGEDRD
jgi:hypothetical protein